MGDWYKTGNYIEISQSADTTRVYNILWSWSYYIRERRGVDELITSFHRLRRRQVSINVSNGHTHTHTYTRARGRTFVRRLYATSRSISKEPFEPEQHTRRRPKKAERELLKTVHASEALKTHTPQILRSRSLPLRPNLSVSHSIRPHEPCCTGQTRFVVSSPAKRKSSSYTFMVTINILVLLYYCVIYAISIVRCVSAIRRYRVTTAITEKYLLGVIVELKLYNISIPTIFRVFVKLS